MRSEDIQVNLEPPVYQQVKDLAPKLGMSMSLYTRMLIINDLRERGLLTDRMIADMAMAS
jgi:hypothetical protein